MARVIYIVRATQVVTSEQHPEGLLSDKSGFPKYFDGENNEDTFETAEAEYLDAVSKMLLDKNPARVMQTVTMERSDGHPFYHRSKGKFPVIPEPEPEPEPEEA